MIQQLIFAVLVLFFVVLPVCGVDHHEVAYKCCKGAPNRTCCKERVEFPEPIDCSPNNSTLNLEMAECIHAHQFPSQNVTPTTCKFVLCIISMKDITLVHHCCHVFENNQNDKRDFCASKCQNWALTSSKPLDQKLADLKSCKSTGNPLFNVRTTRISIVIQSFSVLWTVCCIWSDWQGVSIPQRVQSWVFVGPRDRVGMFYYSWLLPNKQL